MAYQTINPYTDEVVKSFPTATDDEIEAAIDRAHEAFLSWRETSFEQRAKIMQNTADILREKQDEFAELITLEMGKLLAEAKAEVELSAKIAEYYANRAADLLAPRFIQSKDFPDDAVALVNDPLGVILMVEPWNFPFYQIIRVAAPQLSAGNTLVMKHASNVPQCAAAFEQVFKDAGAPDGVFQNLYASHEHSNLVINDPRIRGVALTGSEAAGASIASVAAKALKKSTLELGGADAFIVLEDADVEKAASWAAFGRHWNAGQVCCSSKRLIVVDAVYDRFIDTYRSKVAALKAGDPRDPQTTLAPLSSKAAVDLLSRQVDEAVRNGASAERIEISEPTHGCFFQPIILTGITTENPAFYEEFFGPVSQIYRVADEQEAIDIANGSPFGLGGSVFTQDIERGRKVARKLETGMVYINQPTKVAADIPFGGVKRSGYGHELIDLGLFEFVNQKVIAVADIDGPF
jgi:succinate-semialdehyde dehydrogenase/glutarate-semialdehyde dehydrogenase